MTGPQPASALGPSAHPTDVGTPVDEVFVEIDYAILQHFSKHLYASPNKAVEELVTNGYDALAHQVDVFLPGTWAEDCLLVWDDGTSMDAQALKHLWWIARSPKELLGGDRVATSADGKTSRRMVGKFGIGKLASYAVGDRLAHLCRRGDEYLLVSVDYQDAPPLTDDPDRDRGFKTPIRSLDEATAHAYVRSLLREEPADLDALLARETWTVAVVDALRADASLTEGRLRWVLGNGMPLRPDFRVRVNGQPVTPSVLKAALCDWSMSTPEIQKGLTAAWADAAKTQVVSGTPAYGTGQDEPVDGGGDATGDEGLHAAKDAWADLPGLGKVRARVRLFDTSLREGRAADHGRSEGFFVYVKGRLLNPDDAKLLLPDPSFGTFNRMQVTIWADGLDEDLLADRERLQRTSDTAGPLAVLQQSLYLAGRSRLDKHDDEKDSESAPITALPAESREFFRQPLTALALHRQAEGEPMLDLRKVSVSAETSTDASPLMTVQPATNTLVLNTGHPLYAAVRRRVGDSRKGREALRLVELMALSDLLLEGHMLDLGVEQDTVEKIITWRGSQLRSLAVRYEKRPDQIVSDTYDASYPGGARFEKALAQLFRLMGFVTDRDGEPGKKDVLLVAPLGEDEFKFTVEAKGSKGAVENDAAEISGASAHAKAAGARFALVVAREFKGFKKPGKEEAAVLQECRTQDPPVSIVTVETLHELYDALHANHYPLTSLVTVLQEIEDPATKLDTVRALRRPVDKFDTRDLLERCWALQQGDNSGLPVSVLTLRTARPDWKAMTKADFDRIVFAVDALSGGLLAYHSDTYAVTMQQSPDVVAEAVEASLAPVPEAADGSDTQDADPPP